MAVSRSLVDICLISEILIWYSLADAIGVASGHFSANVQAVERRR